MDDMQRTALFQGMRLALMESLTRLIDEQRGVHQLVDVLPVAWLAAADVAGRTVGIATQLGHLPVERQGVVLPIAYAMMGDAAMQASKRTRFSFDWNALLVGTKP